METKFNFNSQVCTSCEQSKRLLALGLKKEAADMHHSYYTRVSFDGSKSHFWKEETGYNEKAIPAWSLHRLLNLSPESVEQEIPYFTKDGNVELVNRDGIVTKAWGGEKVYMML